ncbi:unnamed protein product, partial [Pleuronectes platessa]
FTCPCVSAEGWCGSHISNKRILLVLLSGLVLGLKGLFLPERRQFCFDADVLSVSLRRVRLSDPAPSPTSEIAQFPTDPVDNP